MFTPIKQYPANGGNHDRAVSGATNSRREDYTVNGETWFPMLPSHNPTPEMLARARSLAAEAWQRRDAVIEAGYHNGGSGAPFSAYAKWSSFVQVCQGGIFVMDRIGRE